jgi:hypothetical protein
MPDVFSRASQNLADIIPVDAAKLAFAAGDGTAFGVGMMTQNININYTQQINRLYEIGTNSTYFVGGRTQGQIAIGRVIGPRPVQVAFYKKYGNMCNARDNTINLTTGFGGCISAGELEAALALGGVAGAAGAVAGGSSKFSMKFCVITTIGITIGAQDMIVNEQLQLMYVSLEVG